MRSLFIGAQFMQRSNETTRLKELQDEQQRLEDEAHWVLPMAAVAGLGASASTSSCVCFFSFGTYCRNTSEVEVVDSFVELDSASVPASGRRSFKNFNAEIERLARRNQGTQQDKELREEKQVQKAADVEMANQYGPVKQGEELIYSTGCSRSSRRPAGTSANIPAFTTTMRATRAPHRPPPHPPHRQLVPATPSPAGRPTRCSRPSPTSVPSSRTSRRPSRYFELFFFFDKMCKIALNITRILQVSLQDYSSLQFSSW